MKNTNKNDSFRRAYIARYTLDADGQNLIETILATDEYWSRELSEKWDSLIKLRRAYEPMLQAWYSDADQVTCMATTNQPYILD